MLPLYNNIEWTHKRKQNSLGEERWATCLQPETCATTFWISFDALFKFFYYFCSLQIANNPCANLLTAHFRLDGHPNVNYLEKVIQNAAHSYLFFEPSQVVDATICLRETKIKYSLLFFAQGDLHSHVRVRKRLRENEARRLFRQMCEVVKTCHEQGIVLRDLKLRKFVFADTERWVETFVYDYDGDEMQVTPYLAGLIWQALNPRSLRYQSHGAYLPCPKMCTVQHSSDF